MCSTTDDFITECQGIDDPDVSKMKHGEVAEMQPPETDADTRLQKCSLDAAKMQPHAGDSESENEAKNAQNESESAKTHHSRGEKNGAIDNPTVDHNRDIKSGKFKSNKSQTQSVADVLGERSVNVLWKAPGPEHQEKFYSGQVGKRLTELIIICLPDFTRQSIHVYPQLVPRNRIKTRW